MVEGVGLNVLFCRDGRSRRSRRFVREPLRLFALGQSVCRDGVCVYSCVFVFCVCMCAHVHMYVRVYNPAVHAKHIRAPAKIVMR